MDSQWHPGRPHAASQITSCIQPSHPCQHPGNRRHTTPIASQLPETRDLESLAECDSTWRPWTDWHDSHIAVNSNGLNLYVLTPRLESFGASGRFLFLRRLTKPFGVSTLTYENKLRTRAADYVTFSGVYSATVSLDPSSTSRTPAHYGRPPLQTSQDSLADFQHHKLTHPNPLPRAFRYLISLVHFCRNCKLNSLSTPHDAHPQAGL